MPTLDLGSVVGPQGPQGVQGIQGIQGETGAAGPNLVSSSTSTALQGVLFGNGSTVEAKALDTTGGAASNASMEATRQMLAPIESTATASQAYAVGDYLVFGGVLHRVTAAIPQGGTITVGTNVSVTDVGNELNNKTPVIGKGVNLLDNWYFVGGGSQQGGGQFPINQRDGWVIVPQNTYKYADAATMQQIDYPSTYYPVDHWGGTVGNSNAYFYVGSTLCVIGGSIEIGTVSPGYIGSVYGIDRWFSWNLYTINNNGINFPESNSANRFIQQPIENPSILSGETVTISALFQNGGLITKSGIAPNISFEVRKSTGNYGIYLNEDAAVQPNNTIFRVWLLGKTYSDTLIAAKLELGSEQTLARNIGTEANPNWVLNDPPPNYGEELAKCQRYYYVSEKSTDSSEFGASGLFAYSDTLLVGNLPFPVRMQRRPDVQIVKFYDLYSGAIIDGSGKSALSYTADAIGSIYTTTAGTFTQGHWYGVRLIADANL